MPNRSRIDTEWSREIVSRANTTLEILKKSLNPSEEIIDHINKLDLFFGIFPDKTISEGWDYIIIKGQALMSVIANSTVSQEVRWSAVTLTCVEEAVALQQTFGEPSELPERLN